MCCPSSLYVNFPDPDMPKMCKMCNFVHKNVCTIHEFATVDKTLYTNLPFGKTQKCQKMAFLAKSEKVLHRATRTLFGTLFSLLSKTTKCQIRPGLKEAKSGILGHRVFTVPKLKPGHSGPFLR